MLFLDGHASFSDDNILHIFLSLLVTNWIDFTQMGLKRQDLRLHTPKRDETYNFPITLTVTSYYIKSKPHQLIGTLDFPIFLVSKYTTLHP